MTWASNQHPIETIAEWFAPIPLALATVWACWKLGLAPIEGAAAGVAALTAGFGGMRFAGHRHQSSTFSFEPASIEPVEADIGELLLEEKDELLELQDELAEIADDSRVVQLFTREEPTPGELVERIADFLGEGRRLAPVGQPEAPRQADASAALQAALANIRASLR